MASLLRNVSAVIGFARQGTFFLRNISSNSSRVVIYSSSTFHKKFHVSAQRFLDDDEDDMDFGSDAYAWRKRRQREVSRDAKQARRMGQEGFNLDTRKEKTEMSLDPEVLYQQIRGLGVVELLEMVETNHSKLDPMHFPAAMRRLNQLRRQQSSQLRDGFVADVTAEKGFQVLCAYLAKLGPQYDAEVACNMLVFLGNFGIDSDHLAVQVFLELMKAHVSDLHLDQMVQLGNAISVMRTTKQTRLIRKALELLVPTKGGDVGILELWDRVTLMDLFGHLLPAEMRSQVLGDIEADVGMVGPVYSLKLFRGLVNAGCDHPALEQHCIDEFVSQQEKLFADELTEILALCVKHDLYCPDLYPLVASTVMEEGCDIAEKLAVLQNFEKHSFVHKDLLLDLTEALSTSLPARLSLPDLFTVLHCLGDAHTTVNKMALAGTLHNIAARLTENLDSITPERLLWACVNLESLHFEVPKVMMKRLFSPDVVRELIDNDKDKIVPGKLSVISKLAALHSHADTVSTETAALVAAASKEVVVAPADLCGAVERAAGGAEYVQHGVKTGLGSTIAHLVQFDAQGNKLTKEEAERRLRDKEPIKRVAVLVFSGSLFNRNTGQMKGALHLYARAMQKEGYTVAVVNQESYDKISEKGKIDYLSYKIHNADQYADLVMVGMDNL